jgi:hypothetical protein
MSSRVSLSQLRFYPLLASPIFNLGVFVVATVGFFFVIDATNPSVILELCLQ